MKERKKERIRQQLEMNDIICRSIEKYLFFSWKKVNTGFPFLPSFLSLVKLVVSGNC